MRDLGMKRSEIDLKSRLRHSHSEAPQVPAAQDRSHITVAVIATLKKGQGLLGFLENMGSPTSP